MIEGVLGNVDAACFNLSMASLEIFLSGDCNMDKESSFDPSLMALQFLSFRWKSTANIILIELAALRGVDAIIELACKLYSLSPTKSRFKRSLVQYVDSTAI